MVLAGAFCACLSIYLFLVYITFGKNLQMKDET